MNVGIGAERGTATLYASVPGSVLGSTFRSPLYDSSSGEQIQLETIDDDCAAHGISQIDLLKLDLEGGEYGALLGASRMLEARAISMIQFEFGQPSIGARTYFADLFQLLEPAYDLFRVLPRGLERLSAYDEMLEVFMSTNYLAIAKPPH